MGANGENRAARLPEALERVRQRPGMYLAGLNTRELGALVLGYFLESPEVLQQLRAGVGEVAPDFRNFVWHEAIAAQAAGKPLKEGTTDTAVLDACFQYVEEALTSIDYFGGGE